MQHSRYILSIFLASILFCQAAFAGGPWTSKKGKYYAKLSEWWVVFDKHYTDVSKIDPNTTTGIFNTFVYAEYGFTDRITGIFNGAIFSRTYRNNQVSATTDDIIIPGEAYNGIGDIDLGLKYGLGSLDQKIRTSVSLYLGIPVGATGKGDEGVLQTGDGEFNQMLQFDAGTGFQIGKLPAYISAYSAFNNRTNNFSDEYRLGIETGVGLFQQKLYLSAKVNTVQSLFNGKTSDVSTGATIFANNTEFTSIGFEGAYMLTKNLGITASHTGVLSGKIIAAAPSNSVGIIYKMN